jgi:MFS transporter, ACS family, tartrate transporter
MSLSSLHSAEEALPYPTDQHADSELGRRTMRKASWRLIPLLSIGFAAAFIDRANVSYAALQMNRDLHFNAGIYGFAAGIFFLSYAVCEVPSNYLLLRFGARRWLARIMLTWGILAAAMVFVRSPASFYILRFLLGMAEAGFFPGVIYYLSLWFPQEMRSRAISRFYVSFPLSNVVMGLIAGVLMNLNGKLGLRGWQWLFLVEALPPILLSVVVFFALPDGPQSASWLAPDERTWILRRLREDAVTATQRGGHTSLFGILKDPRVALIGIFFFFTLGSSYAFSFYAPQIFVIVTGWNVTRVGFLLAAISLLGAAAMLFFAYISDKTQKRLPYIVVLSLLMAAGFLASGIAHTAWIVVPAVTLAIVSFYGLEGPAVCLMTTFTDGPPTAIAIAAINTMAIAGGFAGPNWMGWSITHTGDYRWGLSMLAVPCAVAAGLIWLTEAVKSSHQRAAETVQS